MLNYLKNLCKKLVPVLLRVRLMTILPALLPIPRLVQYLATASFGSPYVFFLYDYYPANVWPYWHGNR